MALAIKRACCCNLRQACIILLYCNLVVYLLELLSNLKEANNRSYSYLQYYVTWLDLLLALIGCVVIMGTIIGIYKKEPSQCWLSLATGFLLIESVYIVYSMIVVNSSSISEVYEDEMQRDSKMSHSDEIFSLNVIFLLVLAFDLYSALVCYSYKEELKQRPVYGIPPGQTNIMSPPNVQFIAAPAPYPAPYPASCPAQPHQYAGLPPQYYTQPAQNPYIPPQCYTQPAQNPDIPPMYPSLPA